MLVTKHFWLPLYEPKLKTNNKKSVRIPKKKVSYTGLEQHEGE